MGVGTAEGAPIPADDGSWSTPQRRYAVMARLEDGKLRAIADAGNGLYVTAVYTDDDTKALLARIDAGPENLTGKNRTVRIWDERFYIPALLMALVILPWFRKGYVFPVLMLLALSAGTARAAAMDDLSQSGAAGTGGLRPEGLRRCRPQIRHALPARRGAVQGEAIRPGRAILRRRCRPADDSGDSLYNKGNSQLMSGKPDDAIASYESVLKQRPGDKAAARNLEIAKKFQEQKRKNRRNSNSKTRTRNNRSGRSRISSRPQTIRIKRSGTTGQERPAARTA